MAVDAYLSSLTGLPTDQVRLVVGNLFCVLLCYYLPKLNNLTTRVAYSTIWGTLLQIYIYSDEPFKLFLMSMVTIITYFLTVKVFPR